MDDDLDSSSFFPFSRTISVPMSIDRKRLVFVCHPLRRMNATGISFGRLWGKRPFAAIAAVQLALQGPEEWNAVLGLMRWPRMEVN
jgi:hypothetical protein